MIIKESKIKFLRLGANKSKNWLNYVNRVKRLDSNVWKIVREADYKPCNLKYGWKIKLSSKVFNIMRRFKVLGEYSCNPKGVDAKVYMKVKKWVK